LTFTPKFDLISGDKALFQQFSIEEREQIHELVMARFKDVIENKSLSLGGKHYLVQTTKRDVIFPMSPVKDHALGLDDSGRDIGVLLLYGFQIAMTFSMILVLLSFVFGTVVGAIQGYFAGAIDITAQRFIEVWAAMPFLYIIILMGSVYGTSFGLLLFLMFIFGWVGISYYMRAEFLRLRSSTYVEAAKIMGLPTHIILFKHILPNALVPLITFFPFSLVGNISALSALDYLGFGLPAQTPSWGQLLSQAQDVPWAWWLIAYPAFALFITMLLWVFVGEGVRAAFDPKKFSRIE
ncbi:MAG: ABC transporter permease subunit, partial [Lentisphaeria bacterium]|nr:ABC transporter permease subunit [Lentisphaeria bacterium]